MAEVKDKNQIIFDVTVRDMEDWIGREITQEELSRLHEVSLEGSQEARSWLGKRANLQ